MNFLIGLVVDIFAALFKHHVGDEKYSKVKILFTVISTILAIVFIGYFLFVLWMFKDYKGV